MTDTRITLTIDGQIPDDTVPSIDDAITRAVHLRGFEVVQFDIEDTD